MLVVVGGVVETVRWWGRSWCHRADLLLLYMGVGVREGVKVQSGVEAGRLS